MCATAQQNKIGGGKFNKSTLLGVGLSSSFLFVSVIDRDHNSFFMPEFTCLVVVLCPFFVFFCWMLFFFGLV